MSRIERGLMVAEALGRDFTQLGNRMLRDGRLSAKAKGLFGIIASHTDGFDISAERLRKWCSDGLASIKSGLQELEKYGYLERSQTHGDDGRVAESTWTITDMPSSGPEVENRPADTTSGNADSGHSNGRAGTLEDGGAGNVSTSGNVTPEPQNRSSGPEVENRTPGTTSGNTPGEGENRRSGPEVGFPPAENRTPKKTTYKNTTSLEEDDGPVVADARRASTGSSARATRGCAASGKSKPRLSPEQKQAIQAVRDRLPRDLDRALPVRLPRNIQDAILAALAAGTPDSRTPQQLVAYRVLPRWEKFWASRFFASQTKPDLLGPLTAMLKPTPPQHACGSPRCDERIDVDFGEPCRTCEMRQVDRRADREADQRASDPSGAADTVPEQPTTHAAFAAPSPYVQCAGPGCTLKMLPTPDGLCRECREETAYV